MSPVSQDRVFRRRSDTRDDLVRRQFTAEELVRGYAAAYETPGPAARYFRSRIHCVDEALHDRAGDLLDVGCGPGMFVRHLRDTRPSDFKITACDQSAAMIDAAIEQVGSSDVQFVVDRIEQLPFPKQSFDVAVAMGVLEYARPREALRELARVVRPDGQLVLTMLNPLSPYRMYEWFFYWPALRVLGRAERLVGVPARRRHGVAHTGIRSVTTRRLRRMLREAGFAPADTMYYDLTAIPPPFDKPVRRWKTGWLDRPERTVSRGFQGLLGSGYLVTARRTR